MAHAESNTYTCQQSEIIRVNANGIDYRIYVSNIDVTNQKVTLKLYDGDNHFVDDALLAPGQTFTYKDNNLYLKVYVNSIYVTSAGTKIAKISVDSSVQSLAPVANFYASPTSGKAPLAVQFYDTR